MSTTRRNQMAEVMNLAWQFVKRNGMSMSEALKTAWQNFKLKARMRVGIAKFYFRKIDGTIREAYGTLKETLTPIVKVYHANRMNQYRFILIQRNKNGDVLRKQIYCSTNKV